MQKAIITCALTGVLTDPKKYPVPVTAKEMAAEALSAHNAGASIVHVHIRNQLTGKTHLPCWDARVCEDIINAIKEKVPQMIINLSTGILGPDISGPVGCIRHIKPEYAACNAGTLNYLKIKDDGSWAWPPIVFDNPVEKIAAFLKVMKETDTRPEFECFDTGHVRSVMLFVKNGLVQKPSINFVMGVQSGMALNAEWLPLLLKEIPKTTPWQVTAIGREEIWAIHSAAAKLGGNLRTGLEDSFYLPDGKKTNANGSMIAALVKIARAAGREITSPQEARTILFHDQD